MQPQEYRFKLHEHSGYGWQPRLSSRAFMSILSNLTAIKIRGTYTHQGRGFLDDVKLETAHRGAAGEPADWVEHCQCPHGYVGQFCESCAPGFHHDPPNGGPFALCVPCNCNGHADICEAETGNSILSSFILYTLYLTLTFFNNLYLKYIIQYFSYIFFRTMHLST